ncbi:hypothetical protein V491_04149 [Pseudogymnoascus sp. VKM F-3775]|nr:hypothetical protein V491_04149 [Pseudogymnoascus sp. VKM F-3775]
MGVTLLHAILFHASPAQLPPSVNASSTSQYPARDKNQVATQQRRCRAMDEYCDHVMASLRVGSKSEDKNGA